MKETIYIGIDPGDVKTAIVIYSPGSDPKILDKAIVDNRYIVKTIQAACRDRINKGYKVVVAIEMIASYGMPVGKTVFETCVWIGRILEAIEDFRYMGIKVTLLERKKIVTHICGSSRGKDSNVRMALIDMFGPAGTKKSPGGTHGVSKDMWSALAVAVTAHSGDDTSRYSMAVY